MGVWTSGGWGTQGAPLGAHTGRGRVCGTDLRYRYGATRTLILDNGRVAVAERWVRVYEPRT